MGTNDAPPADHSAWAPFRHRLFAAMWTAQFVSNIGGWMQTVGAQWLMLTMTGSAAYVALVSTAGSLPIVLFAVLAGAVGDLVDRRRFLLVAQGLTLVAAAALGALALAGLVTPWILLALTFALGTGTALTAPTWQTLQPELVDPPERQQAISLGAVNQNLARATGPAIGGVILAATSAGTVFLVNAATYLAVIAVIAAWRSARPADALPREHLGGAIRAGGRYVAASPALRVIMVRALLFIIFASSIWALLPLAARSQFHLGSGGYGLLLGCVGLGAVGGALLLPRLRTLLPPGGQLTAGSLGLAAVALVLALVHVTAVAAVALAAGGLSWVLALSTLNSAYQLTLPGWVKARGMSFYLIVFQGGNAVGSAVFGLMAQQAGLTATFLTIGVALAIGPLAGLWLRFQAIPPAQLLPAGDWPAPVITGVQAAGEPTGPVMVFIEYRPQAGKRDDLIAALRDARFSRRRTGASAWCLWRDAANPDRVAEQFTVASWDEHLRQHERATRRDSARLAKIRAMTDPDKEPVITHWLVARELPGGGEVPGELGQVRHTQAGCLVVPLAWVAGEEDVVVAGARLVQRGDRAVGPGGERVQLRVPQPDAVP
jgi:predicted MFS family arabinose efflux permease